LLTEFFGSEITKTAELMLVQPIVFRDELLAFG